MRRPRRTPADDHDSYWPKPQERPRESLPESLTARQARLVKTVRFHGHSPAHPCLSVFDGRGWAILYVPGQLDRYGVQQHESLCRVRTSTIREVVALGLVGAGPTGPSEEWPGLPDRKTVTPLSTWTCPVGDGDEPRDTASHPDAYDGVGSLHPSSFRRPTLRQSKPGECVTLTDDPGATSCQPTTARSSGSAADRGRVRR